MKLRKHSLDDIDHQFQEVLDRIGIKDEEQVKMKNVSLDLKMKVIISLETQCSKENNIKVFLDVLKQRNSLLNILSLKGIMEENKPEFIEIFKKHDGLRILEDLTYKILFETEQMYSLNKNLYERCHYENSSRRGTVWHDKGFNLEYDFQMYYAIGKNKNRCGVELMPSSRESMLDEVLGCILAIAMLYQCLEFDIAKIVKNVYLFVYTQNFYNLIDFYARHCIERLDFLFTSDKPHLCILNTYFYDIYRECSKYNAINNFLLSDRYRGIVLFILSEIRNDNKEGLMNHEINPYEKLSNKKQVTASKVVGNKDHYRNDSTHDEPKNINADTSIYEKNYKQETALSVKTETKRKLCNIIDHLENVALINFIPCYLDNLIKDPDAFKENGCTLEAIKEIEKMKKENERLQREIERLQLAVVNMDNRNTPTPVKSKVEEVVQYPPEPKKIEIEVEKKLNNMTIKPKKMPFKRKAASKETNVHLLPYANKTYYPLRWNKTTKNGNIWESIGTEMKFEILTQIFTPEDLSCYEKKLNTVGKQGKILSTVKTVFSSKKGQAISIALGRVKMTDQEIRLNIFQLNESRFGENMIRQLVKNFPKKDEFELLRNLKTEVELKREAVGRAEQFYFEFIYCQEELYKNLTAIYFKMTYPANAITIREMISKLTKIYTCALESKALREFCQYTLFLGNIFNSNSFLGNAEGYNFESISAMIEYNGNNKEKLIDDVMNKMQHDIIADLKIITAENLKYDGLCIQFTDVLADYDMVVLTTEVENYLKPLIEDLKLLKVSYQEINNLYSRFNKYFNGENVFDIFGALLSELQKHK